METVNPNDGGQSRQQRWSELSTALIGALTSAGREGFDVADLLASSAAHAAANLGGSEELLAGRSGSWEADLLRQLVNGTAPEDEIDRWRTEPVKISLDVERELFDLGLGRAFDDEVEAAWERATVADDDGVSEREEALANEIEAVWNDDIDEYRRALRQQLEIVAAERGISTGVEVATGVSPLAESLSDWREEELLDIARRRAVVPGVGAPPTADAIGFLSAVPAEDQGYTDRARRRLAASSGDSSGEVAPWPVR